MLKTAANVIGTEFTGPHLVYDLPSQHPGNRIVGQHVWEKASVRV